MEYCPGIPLYAALARPEFGNSNVLRASANKYAEAILTLSGSLSIDELDLSVRNTLYDPLTEELVLIDFTSRTPSVSAPEHMNRIDFVLGGFLAGALTIPLHRATSLNFHASKQLVLFCRYLIDSLSASGAISVVDVRDVAWRYYWHRSKNNGILRRAWFSTAGWGIYWVLLSRVLQNRRQGR